MEITVSKHLLKYPMNEGVYTINSTDQDVINVHPDGSAWVYKFGGYEPERFTYTGTLIAEDEENGYFYSFTFNEGILKYYSATKEFNNNEI